MAYTEAVKRATLKYRQKNIKRYEINLNRDTDADIIGSLEGKNVQGEFKRLMRARVDRQIFTNKQINLLKECIDMAVIAAEERIEDEQEEINRSREVMEKAKGHGIDQVVERKQKQIGASESTIKNLEARKEELKELRDYIDGVYYGERETVFI